MATKRRRRPTTTTKRRTTTARKRRTTRKKKALTFEVEKHVAREIWAVVYFALGALTWLSLNQQLGFLGDLWTSLLKPIFGMGMAVVPFILFFMGGSVFFSKKINWGLTRFTGLVALSVAILGFIHMSVPLEESLEVAKAGNSGGYIGFVSSFIFTSAFGFTGAYVLLTATLLIGVLLTLQVSLGDIVRTFVPSANTVKRAIKVATPDLKVIQPDFSEFEDDLKIVKPSFMEDEENEAAMTIKEVSAKEVEDRLKRDYKKEEDAKKKEEGEVIMVDQKKTGNANWDYPSLDLLNSSRETFSLNKDDLKSKATLIKDKLEQFGINVSMHEVHVGPTVVQYTLKPASGVKLSKITSLKNDLALALAAPAVRIEAPIPGKSLVGIEIPNASRATVHMREIMESREYKGMGSDLKLALGRNVSGGSVVVDLSKMPHLLIAGATGSGKSVGMNSFLISMLYNNSPRELKMIMIDPKQVELRPYNGLPHLLTPVITDAEKAATSLRWAVAEMNRRYKVFGDAGARNLEEYNKGRRKNDRMSKIVIVIDELADLMMQAQKEVEASICRIAQMARAVGMHLIIATQRPSVDVITGLIKANIPARIAFTVASSIDSRTILDQSGAEDLLGAGDMLYLSGTMGKPIRVQGIYVSREEVERVTNKLKLTLEDEPNYIEDIVSKTTSQQSVRGMPDMPDVPKTDEDLMALAIECLKKNRKSASTSSMQRYLRIGYSRAARIIDMLEDQGLIGPANGSKARDVFVKFEEEEEA
ncbi:MAG: S-DNA-T family DNA segregation ATPase FtsK/SpoIIIE [Oceanicoccus sp.]|jgi:S-DNA-T family DNA segregation ATPase FtsK/SpoIIIE